MAQCYECKEELSGSWKLTEGFQDYSKTGRYLGIKNGYFMYQGAPNWVYCYCNQCYRTEVLRLAATYNTETEKEITAQKNQFKELQQVAETITREVSAAQQQLTQLSIDKASIQHQKEQLISNATALQLHNVRLTEEVTGLQQQLENTNKLIQQKNALTNEITTLQQQKQQLTSEIDSLQNLHTQLKIDIHNH
jgi:DNA repair exonuclease SbcCD ATPase subunit